MKYPHPESVMLEFKEKIPTKNQIVKTVLGFCNRFGGRLIIGVKDNRDIVGLPETQVEELIDSLHESIFKSCSPTILPTIYLQRFDDDIVLVIEVSAGVNKPYFLNSEGQNKGTYIRLGSVTVNATAEIIEELKWQAKGFFADETPVYNATPAELSEKRFFDFLQARKLSYRIEEQQKLIKHYKLTIDEHGRTYPTVAGMLLFGVDPQRYFTESFIICTHFKGVAGREAIATRDCTGNLFQQAEDSIAFILSRLNREFKIKSRKREERFEIPEIAIREVVINAIVHRDYYIAGPIKIAIYDDRLEIFSPGNFPGPLQVDQLEMGITYIRNPVIGKIFREAGYIEKLGSGFLTLFRSYRQYQLPKPTVIESTGFVKCILPRPTQKTGSVTVEDHIQKILSLFYISNEITAQDVVKLLHVSRQTASRILANLVKENILMRQGKGPSSYYVKIES